MEQYLCFLPHRIFNRPFRIHRVEKSRSREYGGSGLGLAIVKRLVEIQGGSLQVESNLGIGTKFTLTFPIPQEDNIR
nr:ATP-binding protein [Aneurinibacillus tyrosinisolvens]